MLWLKSLIFQPFSSVNLFVPDQEKYQFENFSSLFERFLLVEISGTKKYTYLMILVFISKCENVDDKKHPFI